MADIVYTFGGKPYLNITNQCPCACVFCIRSEKDGLGSADSLWHQADPTWSEIEAALAQFDFSQAGEAVFCGYGEPLCAQENLQKTAQWLKNKFPTLKLRLNTNGLGSLINESETTEALVGLIDSVSISLNAPNAARYHALVQSCYGEKAFDAMLRFAAQCKKLLPKTTFSVVDVLTDEELDACRALAQDMGIPLRVRAKS
jgi:radical SAM enzyme (TIGR04100 family)